jgi:hypothetical protein
MGASSVGILYLDRRLNFGPISSCYELMLDGNWISFLEAVDAEDYGEEDYRGHILSLT